MIWCERFTIGVFIILALILHFLIGHHNDSHNYEIIVTKLVLPFWLVSRVIDFCIWGRVRIKKDIH